MRASWPTGSASDFHDRDVAHIAARLRLDASDFDHTAYIARTRQRHRIQILELAGFRPFDGGAAQWLDKELEVMVRSQLRPSWCSTRSARAASRTAQSQHDASRGGWCRER